MKARFSGVVIAVTGILGVGIPEGTAQKTLAPPKTNHPTLENAPPLGGKEAIARFGSVTGEKVTDGVLLLKGKYLPPPYQIDRIGLTLVLNGDHVIYRGHWVKEPEKIDPVKPEPPPGLEDATSLDDLTYVRADGLKVRYHLQMRGYYLLLYKDKPRKAVEEIVKFYRSLPFVKGVSVHPEAWDFLEIEFDDGTKTKFMVIGEINRRAPNQKEVVEWLDSAREDTEKALGKGGIALPCESYCFDWALKEIPVWEKNQARHLLEALEEELGETKNPEALKKRFEKYVSARRFDLEDWKVLAKNFDYSPELKQRVAGYPYKKLEEASRPK